MSKRKQIELPTRSTLYILTDGTYGPTVYESAADVPDGLTVGVYELVRIAKAKHSVTFEEV